MHVIAKVTDGDLDLKGFDFRWEAEDYFWRWEGERKRLSKIDGVPRRGHYIPNVGSLSEAARVFWKSRHAHRTKAGVTWR